MQGRVILQSLERRQEREIRRAWFWVQWTVASLIGGLGGLLAGVFFLGPLAMVGGAFGLGAAQALVLSRIFRQPARWMVLTMLGGLLAAIAVLLGSRVATSLLGSSWGTMVLGAVTGGMIAAPQWALLRRPAQPAAVWVLAGAVAGAAAIALAGLSLRVIGELEGGVLLLAAFIAWTAYGLISSSALLWLLVTGPNTDRQMS